MSGIFFDRPTPLLDALFGPVAPALSAGRPSPPVPLFGPTGRQVGLASAGLGIRTYQTGIPTRPKVVDWGVAGLVRPAMNADPIQNELGTPRIYPTSPPVPERHFSVREYPQSFDREEKTPSPNGRAARFQPIGSPPPSNPGVWRSGGIRQY